MDTGYSKLLSRRPDSQAVARLFFFPYGGAGASIANPYVTLLSPLIDVVPIQLPGREDRIKEAPFTRMEPLINALVLAVMPYVDVPFLLWGHCSGAVIAFELASRLRKQLGLEPSGLLVSACAAPQLIYPDSSSSLHLLPDKQFLLQVQQIMEGAFLNESGSNQALQILLPGIKADFAIYETYVYQQDEPFSCPIFAFGGSCDKRVSEDHLRAWQHQTTEDFICKIFDGEQHFFINNRTLELAHNIKLFLEKNFQ